MFNADLVTTDERDLVRCRHSVLERFRASPPEFYAYHIAKTMEVGEPSEAMRLGTAVDCLILTPNEAEARITVIDAALSKSTKKVDLATKKAIKSNVKGQGFAWLTQADYDRARRMADAARNDREVAELLSQAFEAQRKVLWDCPLTGWPKQATVDYYTKSLIIDLKTTANWNLHPRRLVSHIYDMGNHRQLALYQEGCEIDSGVKPKTKLIYIGSEQPHETVVMEVNGDEIGLGHRENMATLDELDEAFCYNLWKGRQAKKVQFGDWVYR